MATSLRMVGNRDLAAHYRGESYRLLFHLKQALGQTPSGGLNRTYPDGTTICIRKFFDNEIILISSPFRGGKREWEKQEINIFLFFDESHFKVYEFGFGDGGFQLQEKEGLDQFPFDHNWYSASLSESRDVSPTVLSNVGNKKHYISTVLDPIIYPSGNAYDDWQFKTGILDLSEWFPDGATRESPSIQPTLLMIHVSISPYTSFGSSFRVGGIVQPYRQTCPEYSLVPLWDPAKETIIETEVLNNGPGAYGKRGYELNDKKYAITWKERAYAGGSSAPSISHNLGGEIWLGWFFFPWMPYLHEIASFPILSYAPGPVITISPVPINPQIYTLQYLDETGMHTVPGILSDAAYYAFNQGAVNQGTTPPYTDLWRVVSGGPGGFSFAGSWTEWEGPAPFEYSLDHSYTQAKSGSASGIYYSPVGGLGKKQILKIKNDFDLSVAWARNRSEIFHKVTGLTGLYYNYWQGIEEYWLPNGDYADTSDGTLNDATSESRTMEITQKLMANDLVIEELLGSMTYEYLRQDLAEGEMSWIFHNEGNLPIWVYGYYITPPGSSSRTETITATAGRNVICVEVLDFDSMQGLPQVDLFIVFYKKISIAHSQTNSYVRSASSAPVGPSKQTQHFPFASGFGAPTETFTANGTRKVEYYVAYKIGDNPLEKVKLAEFNSSLTSPGGALVHSGSGDRLWGVSCQLNEDLIVYHYQKEEYLNNGTAPAYDSPMNFEDISFQGTTKLWDPKKIVVGVINVSHEMASKAGLAHERFEFDPAATELIYSVGLHRNEKERMEEEE